MIKNNKNNNISFKDEVNAINLEYEQLKVGKRNLSKMTIEETFTYQQELQNFTKKANALTARMNEETEKANALTARMNEETECINADTKRELLSYDKWFKHFNFVSCILIVAVSLAIVGSIIVLLCKVFGVIK